MSAVVCPCDEVEHILEIKNAPRGKGPLFLKLVTPTLWTAHIVNEVVGKPKVNTGTVQGYRIEPVLGEIENGLGRMDPERRRRVGAIILVSRRFLKFPTVLCDEHWLDNVLEVLIKPIWLFKPPWIDGESGKTLGMQHQDLPAESFPFYELAMSDPRSS